MPNKEKKGVVKAAVNAEFTKLRGMKFKDKRWYIWEYYKLHIILTAVVVFMVGYFVNALFINPPKKVYLGIAITDTYSDYDTAKVISDALCEAVLPEEYAARYTIDVNNFFLDESQPELSQAIMQKFTAMLMMREIDIILMGDESIAEMANEGVLTDLGDYLDAADLAAHESQITRVDLAPPDDSSGESYPWENVPCALSLEGNEFFASLGLNSGGMYLTVVGAAKSPENVEAAVKYIMGWN